MNIGHTDKTITVCGQHVVFGQVRTGSEVHKDFSILAKRNHGRGRNFLFTAVQQRSIPVLGIGIAIGGETPQATGEIRDVNVVCFPIQVVIYHGWTGGLVAD